MNLINKLTLILLLSIIVSCDKCKKEDPPQQIDTTVLPPATTTGENTMGCLVNGEVWLPLKENTLGNLVYDVSFEVAPLSQGGGVFIQAIKDYNNVLNFINVAVEDVNQIGLYYYPTWALNNVFGYECGSYNLDTLFTNSINITNLDYPNSIVSGTFIMRVIKDDCDTLTLTEGRFDLSGN